jgi:hypothetical protein
MPFLQSSPPISIRNITNLFGGTGRLKEYYRGGSYVPASKTVNFTAREPSSGENQNVPNYMFEDNSDTSSTYIVWAGTTIAQVAYGTSAYTSGIYTYYRGSLFATSGLDNYYGIYREYPSSYSQNINTGIPTSGQLILTQFLGAEKP